MALDSGDEPGDMESSLLLRPLRGVDVPMLEARTEADGEKSGRLWTMSFATWWLLVRTDRTRLGWIAESNGHPVGYIDAQKDGERLWVGLVVFRPYRRLGLGTEMLRRLESETPFSSAQVVTFAVELRHKAGLRLAESAGFARSGVDMDGLTMWSRRPITEPDTAAV